MVAWIARALSTGQPTDPRVTVVATPEPDTVPSRKPAT